MPSTRSTKSSAPGSSRASKPRKDVAAVRRKNSAFMNRSYCLSLIAVGIAVLLLSAASELRAEGEESDGDVKAVTDPKLNSPKEALRLQLFKETPVLPTCQPLKADPRGGLQNVEGDLSNFVKKL